MSDRKVVALRFNIELMDWFDETFPMRGYKQWFFESCLKQLHKLYQEGKALPPVDLMEITVMEVSKET